MPKDTGGDNSRQTRIRRPPARLNDYVVYKLQSVNEKIDTETTANQMAGSDSEDKSTDHSVTNGQSGPKPIA